MKRVVLTQDIFRAPTFGLTGNGFLYQWLDGLLRGMFERSGWQVSLGAPIGAGGTFDTEAAADLLELPRAAAGWAQIHATTDASPQLDRLLGTLFASDLIYGFELPPYLISWAERHGIPFVSLAPAQPRFLPDLLASVVTNVRPIGALLSDHLVPEDSLHEAAAFFSASRRRRHDSPLLAQGRFGLFAGQMAIDAAVVANGRIVLPTDHIDAIRAVAETVDRLFIRPHPLESDHSVLHALAAHVPNATMTSLPVYDLLVSPCVTDIVALSSSVLAEAGLFGKRAHRLMICDRDRTIADRQHLQPLLCTLQDVLRATACFLGRGWNGSASAAGHAPFRESLGMQWGLADTPLPDLLVAGTPVACASPGLSRASLVDGWTQPDEFCTWSNALQARLLFRTSQNTDFRLRLTLHSLPFTDVAGQAVVLRTRGGTILFHQFQAAGEAVLDLPVTSADLVGNTLLEIGIETDLLQTPAALGLGNDHRLLGIGLRSVEVLGPDYVEDESLSQ